MLRPDAPALRAKYFLIASLVSFASLLLAAILHAGPGATWTWLIVLPLVFTIWAVIYPLQRLYSRRQIYRFEKDHLVVERSFLTKIRRVIPWSSIRETELVEDVFDRVLGVATIRVITSRKPLLLRGLKDNNNVEIDIKRRIAGKRRSERSDPPKVYVSSVIRTPSSSAWN